MMTWILKGCAYGVAFQPRRVQLFLGNQLGEILRLIGFRKKVVFENLARAYPQDENMRRQVFYRSYRHLGNLILEILILFGPMRSFIQKYGRVDGVEHIREAQKKGKGIIFLASHLGNWEVMAALGGVVARADVMMVTKQLKPAWLHRAIQQGRLKCEVKATYEPKTLKDVLGHLKRNGSVGVVHDQYVGPPVGVRVPFFGHPVGTSMLIATLAKRTGATVLPVVISRNAQGVLILSVHPALSWIAHENSHVELALNSAHYANVVESSIYEFPEQWLWTHRRFKGNLAPLEPEEWAQPRVRA